MKKKNVVIQLLPGHLDLIVYEGERRVDARRIDLETAEEPTEWIKVVRRSAVTLRQHAEETGAAGCPARVLYRSPTQSVDLPGFAVKTAGEAIEAAVLSVMDSVSFSTLSAVAEAAIVGRDARGEQKQIHVAVVAEREDIARTIIQLVEEAGLHFVSACPLDAAVMASFLRDELAAKGECRGSLYIGTHSSYFVVARNGSLLFSRRIDVGLETLAASLTRPIVVAGLSDPVELDLEEARSLLDHHGIPGRDDVVDSSRNLRGGQIVPLLQPVLQRFVVELRQSIRFGVAEEDRAGIRLRVTGPGSALPGLPALLAGELDLDLDADASNRDTGDWLRPGAEAGEVVDALREPRFLERVNVMPRDIGEARRRGRLRRWALTGVAAAVLIILSDAVRYHVQLTGARERAEVLAAQIDDIQTLEATTEKLRSVVTAKERIERSIRKETAFGPDLSACMRELSRITPASIRFESMNFDRRESKSFGTVSGIAASGADETDAVELEQFIKALDGSPLFDGIALRNVHKGALGRLAGQRFEATFEVVEVPRTETTARNETTGGTEG